MSDESSYSFSPLVNQGVIALSDSEKAEVLADNLETQFQHAIDPSVPAVIGMVDVGLRSFFMAPASERSIPNRSLKLIPQRAISLLVLIFKAILCTHHFPTAWKHARVIGMLKPGRIQHCLHPIGPLVFWTHLVNYLKKSYWVGSYMK